MVRFIRVWVRLEMGLGPGQISATLGLGESGADVGVGGALSCVRVNTVTEHCMALQGIVCMMQVPDHLCLPSSCCLAVA